MNLTPAELKDLKQLVIDASNSGWYEDGEGVLSSRTGLFLFRTKGDRWRWFVEGSGFQSIAFRHLEWAIDDLRRLALGKVAFLKEV